MDEREVGGNVQRVGPIEQAGRGAVVLHQRKPFDPIGISRGIRQIVMGTPHEFPNDRHFTRECQLKHSVDS
jgi:hypothetical protein